MTAVHDRELDVVVYGATGFVGRLVAEYLAAHAPADVRVGLGGRSAERLAAVRDALGAAAADWPLIVADAGDDAALATMAERTRVVATTVGPYAKYGLGVAAACARTGTDYCDLTGEVLFVRDVIDRHHDDAVASGARLVPACGFDSVPSDLGVHALFTRARADGEGALTDTVLVVRSARGALGGGTVDSVRGVIDEVLGNPRRRALVADPYALSPDRDAEPAGDSRTGTSVGRLDDLGVWAGPFIMASFNSRIVRRSNALRGWAYGRGFRYREVVGVGSGPLGPVAAVGLAAAHVGGVAALAFPPTRALLDRVLPDPGEGPDEQTRREGHFRFDIHTTTETGARYVAEVAAQGDPGFAATSLMFAESALCLARDRDRLPDHAGVLTPATAMGEPLGDRLRAAGMRLSVDRR